MEKSPRFIVLASVLKSKPSAQPLISAGVVFLLLNNSIPEAAVVRYSSNLLIRD